MILKYTCENYNEEARILFKKQLKCEIKINV